MRSALPIVEQPPATTLGAAIGKLLWSFFCWTLAFGSVIYVALLF